MKGLHGGIPLAVLAATARARAQVIGSHGGPGSADVGNHASVPTENTATTTVNEDFQDDHSFELEHEVNVYPTGHGHHKRVAGGPGASLIGGPSGDDIGSAFGAATVNSFSSEVNEAYKDDHSIDIEKTTIVKPHHYRRGDNFPEVPVKPTLIGGPTGDDIGNVADIPTLNEFTSSVNEAYKDDHSVNVDKTTIVKPHHYRRDGNFREEYDKPSGISGPSGDDIGNAAVIPTLNEFTSAVKASYIDDHSVDVDKTTIIEPHHRRRGDNFPDGPVKLTLIGGPAGDDIGNAAAIPTLNEFTSSVTASYADDHSVDIGKTTIVKPGSQHDKEHHAWGFHHPPKHEARAVPASAIDDRSGYDIGNAAYIPNVNDFTSTVDGKYQDDHSVKVHETEVISPDDDHIHPIEPHHEDHQDHEGPQDHQDHEGPQDHQDHEGPQDHQDHEGHQDHQDHEDHEDHEDHGFEQPSVHSGEEEHAPPAPAQHESEPESDSECTKVHQVVHTVTSTRTSVETPTFTVWPQPADSESEQDSSNQYPAAGTPSSPQGDDQAPADAEYESGHDNNNWGPESGSSWSDSQDHEHSAGAEAAADPRDGTEHDNSNWDPESGSSWSDSQDHEHSAGAEDAEGKEAAAADPQDESEHQNSNSDAEAGPGWSNSQDPEHSADAEDADGKEKAAADDESEHDNNNWGPESGSSWSDSQDHEHSADAEDADEKEEAPADPQDESEYHNSNSDAEAGSSWSNSQDPAQSGPSEYQAPSEGQGQDESSEWSSSPSHSDEQNSHDASEAYGAQSTHAAWQPAPTGVAPGSQAAESSHIQYQPSPTASGEFHAPGPSSTVAKASSFSVVPVFVPSATPWAHEHDSVVVASSGTPGLSAFRVHSAAVPTGVSAEQKHGPSPSPSPSTRGFEQFTGGAGRVAKVEGLCGVLAGVFTLLAFAL
ncbi:hypothetical protein BDW75DRAFT_162747 [Aspergillus navahoensis]